MRALKVRLKAAALAVLIGGCLAFPAAAEDDATAESTTSPCQALCNAGYADCLAAGNSLSSCVDAASQCSANCSGSSPPSDD